MATKTALERIAEIEANAAAEVAKLKDEALNALKEERAGLLDQVKKLDKQIKDLGGRTSRTTGSGSNKSQGDASKVSGAKFASIVKATPGIHHKKIAKELGVAPADALAYLLKNEDKFSSKRKASVYYVTSK